MLYTRTATRTSHNKLIFPLKRQFCFSHGQTQELPFKVLLFPWHLNGKWSLAKQQHPGLWSREKKLDTWHIYEMKENGRGKHLKHPEKLKGILSTPRTCWGLCFGSWEKYRTTHNIGPVFTNTRGSGPWEALKQSILVSVAGKGSIVSRGDTPALLLFRDLESPHHSHSPLQALMGAQGCFQQHHPRPQSGSNLHGSGKLNL